jgi:hypothetical protein
MVKVVGGKYGESFVYNRATGEKKLKAPVDAAELVKSGEWSYAPPEAVAAPVVPVAAPEPAAEAEPVNPQRGPGRPRRSA